jgi:hypothetical protein
LPPGAPIWSPYSDHYAETGPRPKRHHPAVERRPRAFSGEHICPTCGLCCECCDRYRSSHSSAAELPRLGAAAASTGRSGASIFCTYWGACRNRLMGGLWTDLLLPIYPRARDPTGALVKAG